MCVTTDRVRIGERDWWPPIHTWFVATLYRSLTHRLVCPQSVPVSIIRSLATDCNTGTITVSLNYALQISHIKSYLHRRTLATKTFLRSLPYSTELSTDNCLGRPSCLQDNSSARTTQKSQSVYCCGGVFTATLHSNGPAHRIRIQLFCFVRLCCGRYLATCLWRHNMTGSAPPPLVFIFVAAQEFFKNEVAFE
jgi:hypothetical protein